jgi:hypothetical protein
MGLLVGRTLGFDYDGMPLNFSMYCSIDAPKKNRAGSSMKWCWKIHSYKSSSLRRNQYFIL